MHRHEMQKYMHEMQKLCMWCTRVCFKNAEIAAGGTAHPYMCRLIFGVEMSVNMFFPFLGGSLMGQKLILLPANR